jgi:hypothetical protein
LADFDTDAFDATALRPPALVLAVDGGLLRRVRFAAAFASDVVRDGLAEFERGLRVAIWPSSWQWQHPVLSLPRARKSWPAGGRENRLDTDA